MLNWKASRHFTKWLYLHKDYKKTAHEMKHEPKTRENMAFFSCLIEYQLAERNKVESKVRKLNKTPRYPYSKKKG